MYNRVNHKMKHIENIFITPYVITKHAGQDKIKPKSTCMSEDRIQVTMKIICYQRSFNPLHVFWCLRRLQGISIWFYLLQCEVPFPLLDFSSLDLWWQSISMFLLVIKKNCDNVMTKQTNTTIYLQYHFL